MNAPLAVSSAIDISPPPVSRARKRRRELSVRCATLQITTEQACLIADFTERRIWMFVPRSGARQILEQAQELIRNAAVEEFGDLRSQVRLRLVLPGGFHHLSARPEGRWSSVIGDAVAAEMESDCPLTLEELTAASLPIDGRTAWSVALPNGQIAPWQEAAAELGLLVDGFWTPASALVEYLAENLSGERVSWSDGRMLVIVEPEKVTPEQARGTALSAVRVAGTRCDPFCTLSMSDPHGTSPAFYPAIWTHSLCRTDPSESWNLARGARAPSDLASRRQRPLARACWWSAVCFAVIGIASLLIAHGQRARLASADDQIRAVWTRYQGAAPRPAMPVDALTKQLNAWRNLRERGMVGRRSGSELARLAQWTAALPPDLLVSVDHVRSSGEETWIEGRVKSQADARRLFESLAAIPGVATDSMRTSSSAGGLVSVSLRLSLSGT